MTSIILILVLVVLIIAYSLFTALVKMGEAGASPSKLLSNILNKGTDKELTDGKDNNVNNDPKLNETIRQWRLAAAVLFGIVMVYYFLFSRVMFSLGPYSWLKYPFFLLIFSTVIVFIVLSQKEKKLKK